MTKDKNNQRKIQLNWDHVESFHKHSDSVLTSYFAPLFPNPTVWMTKSDIIKTNRSQGYEPWSV